MGRATQLLAGARELTATARNENPSRDRQSSLSDGKMQQLMRLSDTLSLLMLNVFHLQMVKVLSSLLRGD